MTTLASDAFTRTNGGLGANWSTITGNGAPQIAANLVQTQAVGNDSYARYNAVAWPNDQWAQCQIVVPVGGSGKAGGPCVRMQPAANSFMLFHAEGVIGGSTTLEIRKNIAGAYTTLATVPGGAANGDILRLEVSGNVYKAYKNNALVLTVTDSALASGFAGIGVFCDTGAVTDFQVDLWSGGDFQSMYLPTDLYF